MTKNTTVSPSPTRLRQYGKCISHGNPSARPSVSCICSESARLTQFVVRNKKEKSGTTMVKIENAFVVWLVFVVRVIFCLIFYDFCLVWLLAPLLLALIVFEVSSVSFPIVKIDRTMQNLNLMTLLTSLNSLVVYGSGVYCSTCFSLNLKIP